MILGNGMMTRDFVYVKDIACAIVLALLRKEGGEDDGGGGRGRAFPPVGGGGEVPAFNVYNVCTGISITINELAARVKSSMGLSLSIVHADPSDGNICILRCNPSRARVGMGFKVALMQEMGLEKMVS